MNNPKSIHSTGIAELRINLPKMATTGYSGKPLWKKLGIQPTTRIWLINPPANYQAILEISISGQLMQKNESPDMIHLFVNSQKEMLRYMKSIKPVIRKNTSISIWVSWYKKSAAIPTDITEDSIRNYALKNDLVDVKVCSVSEIWSGLKLVVPIAKR